MNQVEFERALRPTALGGMAAVLETRLRQAQAEPMAPINLIACLVSDEPARRSDRRCNVVASRQASAIRTSAWIILTSP